MTSAKAIKAKLKGKKRNEDRPTPSKDLLSTGSTLLNLAATGRVKGGVGKEDYVLIVGDSQAGKTWIALTMLAEAANNPAFDDYELIYDNVENGAKMDLAKFFGKKMASRVRPPRRSKTGEALYSETVQEMYYNIDDAMDRGPCIYVMDSMDGLEAEEDIEQFSKEKTAYLKGRETTGSYGMAKAKRNSTGTRSVIRKLRKTRSILAIIAQTRDKVGGVVPGQKTRGGGKAMKFYAHVEIWLSVKGSIAKKIGKGSKKKLVSQGTLAKIKVEKSRHTGRERTVEVPIYNSFGIDDTGSCVQYLVDNGHWTKRAGMIVAKEFKMSGKKEAVIRYIEENAGEEQLRAVVAGVWDELEEQLKIKRKSRYA